MRQDVDLDTVLLALKQVIEKTFDKNKWLELGLLTKSKDIIQNHPRLLRSLDFGDGDYGERILEVLPKILGDEFENLDAVEDFVELEDWLRDNNPRLHAQLYQSNPTHLDKIGKVSQIRNMSELKKHIERIKGSITKDPELAVGSSKDLLETVLKTILVDNKEPIKSDEDIPSLLKRVQKILLLDPRDVGKTTKEDEMFKRVLSNLGQVVVGVAELRNLVGSGHGRAESPIVVQAKTSKVDSIHAELVVGAAATIATYLLEIWEKKRKSSAPLGTPTKRSFG